MKSLILLLTAASLFQFTEQFHISKRELTEYDLTSFIVNTCSADKPEMIIQNLCDQTLQSALMGNFPFLTLYCKTMGSGKRYCSNVNRESTKYTIAKKYYRRFTRSLPDSNKDEDVASGFDIGKFIVQMCLTKQKTDSTNFLCNRAIYMAQRGRYPEINDYCKSNKSSTYCKYLLSSSSSNINNNDNDSNNSNNNDDTKKKIDNI